MYYVDIALCVIRALFKIIIDSDLRFDSVNKIAHFDLDAILYFNRTNTATDINC